MVLPRIKRTRRRIGRLPGLSMSVVNLSQIRVLLVAGKTQSTQVLRTVLNLAGMTRIVTTDDTRYALELLTVEPFHAIFVEGPVLHDGTPFALAARRTPALLNPMLPIFAVYAHARRRDVETARDLGVHDVICRPVSPRTIGNKLQAALAAPRPFIAAPDFFGPDRRAKLRPAFFGQDRRSRTPRKTKVLVTEV